MMPENPLFQEYFESVYGNRWKAIFLALRNEDHKVARPNLFFDQSQRLDLDIPGLLDLSDDCPNTYEIDDDKFSMDHLATSLWPYYRMDPASIAPANALKVAPGHEVLDMCAAPGGKTLVLLESLVNGSSNETDWDLSGFLTANELSAKRRHRMMSVFKRYVPKPIRSRIKITGGDGSKIGLNRKDFYDRILLDAPCSGERGLVQKASEFTAWKPKRSKSFGIRQYALLSSAFMALKPGGRIVYSTCSLSPYENDEVVAKLLKRHSEQAQVVTEEMHNKADQTQYGQQFLPDQKGWGPIYFSVIEKQ